MKKEDIAIRYGSCQIRNISWKCDDLNTYILAARTRMTTFSTKLFLNNSAKQLFGIK